MKIHNERANLISDYLREHQNAILDRKEPYEIDGKRNELEVIRLPLDALVYNIRNGRFAAELQELEASEGRRLDPEVEKDKAKIQELLLKDQTKTEWLKKDIRRVGQLKPATITFDGFIINGNRRAAILSLLHKETGDPRFRYLEAVRLPPEVSASDLWRFEAGFQLAVELKADYGPVNELLKIKEGKTYGLKNKEIALILGGDNTAETVQMKLKRLELIEDYLVYFGQDKRYSIVERRVEHFINIVNIIQRSEWKKLSIEEQTLILHAAYHMIHDTDVAHLEIRKIGLMVKEDPKAALEFANKALQISGEKEQFEAKSMDTQMTFDTLKEEIEELETKLLSPETPVSKPQKINKTAETPEKIRPKPTINDVNKEQLKDLFSTTVEKVALVKEKKKPGQIIKRVESNLQALNDLSSEHLKPFIKDFQRIEELVKSLSTRFR